MSRPGNRWVGTAHFQNMAQLAEVKAGELSLQTDTYWPNTRYTHTHMHAVYLKIYTWKYFQDTSLTLRNTSTGHFNILHLSGKSREEWGVWLWTCMWACWLAAPYLAVQTVLHLCFALWTGLAGLSTKCTWLHYDRYEIANAPSHTFILHVLSDLQPLGMQTWHKWICYLKEVVKWHLWCNSGVT